MAQHGSIDRANNAPIWAPALVNKTPNSDNRDAMFGNTTPDAFVPGQTVGIFGYAANEVSQYGGAIPSTGWNLVRTGSGGRAGRVQYECLVAGGFATDTDIDERLWIVSEAGARTKNTHTSTTFTVVANVIPTETILYQWQANSGVGFANLADAGVYSNVTTAAMFISNTATLNGHSFRVLLDATAYPEVIGANNLLTVNAAVITVNTQPASVTKNTHTSTSFIVVDSIVPSVVTKTYLWQKWNGSAFANVSGGVYSGETTDTLAVSNTATLNAAIYRVVLGGIDAANVNSANAILTVNAAVITIDDEPLANTANTGDPATFRVVSSVVPVEVTMTYQWEMWGGASFANIAANSIFTGVTASNLVITDTTGLDNTVVRVVVRGVDAANVTSTNAILTVV